MGNPDFNNDGTLNLGDGGDDFTFPDGFSATTPSPATINLNCDIITSDDAVTLGNVNLSGNTTITTAGGTLTIGTIDGGSDLNIDTTGGTNTGAIAFNGAIGGGTDPVNLTVNSKAAVELPSTSITGDLTVTAGGDITQTAATTLTVGGAADFTAPDTNNILLGEANTFNGTVSFLSGGTLANVTVQDTTAFDVEALTITGTLTVIAGGAVTQGGAISGTTLHVKTTVDGGADISLNTFANTFTTVSLETRNGADGADAAGAIAYDDTGGYDLGTDAAVSAGIRTTSTVSLSGGGNLTQSGEVIADGNMTTVNVGANDITLTDGGNDFATVVVNGGAAAVQITDADDIDLGGTGAAVTSFTVTSGGNMTQSGAVSVTGVTTLNAGANDITLTDGGNDFATVTVNGGAGTVQITDTDDIVLGGTGAPVTSLTVIAGGTVTQSAAVSGTTLHVKTTLTGGAGITLNTGTNDFDQVSLETRDSGDGADDGGAISYDDSDGYDLFTDASGSAGIRTTSTVSLSGGGNLTQSGEVIAAGGTTTVDVGANDITLDRWSERFCHGDGQRRGCCGADNRR